MSACAVYIYSLSNLLKAKTIPNKDYLWNLFSQCRMKQSFKHTVSVVNIKKMLSPGDPSVLTVLSFSSSFQIASGFCLADCEKFQLRF